MSHKQKRYTSDVTAEQWTIIRPLLPLKNDGPGRPIELEMRAVVNAIFYINRTGCQWENLPHDFPNFNSVYYHFRKWSLDGTWQRINEALRRQERQQREREAQPSAAIIDSQSVKTTEAGGERGYDAGKRVQGRKRHILVDTVGNVLEVVVHAASVQDRDGARLLFAKLSETLIAHLQKIWADAAYRGKLIEWVHEHLDAVLDIVERDPEQKGFHVLPKRWVVERTLAWLGRYRRLSKDYEHSLSSSEGMIYVASIHSMLKRIAAA